VKDKSLKIVKKELFLSIPAFVVTPGTKMKISGAYKQQPKENLSIK